MRKINPADLEARIRYHVIALRGAGWETTNSCGHDMFVRIAGELSDLPALHASLVKLGYEDFEVSFHEGGNQTWGKLGVKFHGSLAGDGKPASLILLKVEPNSIPLYFVISTRDYGGEQSDSHDAYFYNEHTCPTNWAHSIIGVIACGDEDPHGFARFVRRLPVPPGMDADGDWTGETDERSWLELFPEIAKS